MIVSIENGKFHYLDRLIFENVSASLDEQDKIGLIGENGAGKTTLIKLILGGLELDSGHIFKKNGISIGYLPQNATFDSENDIYAEMLDVFAAEIAMEKQLRDMEETMATINHESSEYREISRKYSQISTHLETVDGYNYSYKIDKMLHGMGFENFTQKVETLSGGEKTRLLLSKLLLQNNDLLILDEPTNHLDHETLCFLEEYLSEYKNALLIVSHDRYFLDKVTKKTWEISACTLDAYRGNYSKYKILKEEKYNRDLEAYHSQQEEIKKLQDFVDKNIVRASSAKSAKSRRNTLEKMEILKPPTREKRPVFTFEFPFESVKEVLKVSNYDITVPEKTLASGIDLAVFKGEKIAIVGKNGTGKSTFLKGLVEAFEKIKAGVSYGKNVSLSYFSQNLENLQGDKTIMEQMWDEFSKFTNQEIREYLAKMLIFSLDTDKKIGELSGGERGKLSFAMICAKKANTIILDEPTNHLDLKSREALEDGLASFDGTLIFVSHDRYFVENLNAKVFAITEFGGIYYDDFESYQQDVNQKRKLAETAEKEEKRDKKALDAPLSKKNLTKKEKQAKIKAKIRFKEVENEISALECEIETQNQLLLSEDLHKDYEKAQAVTGRIAVLEEKLAVLFEEWEEVGFLIEE
ncbi:MAG: ABC-F family ATP-binding cassette domain-containing protein [Bacillota bacterium]